MIPFPDLVGLVSLFLPFNATTIPVHPSYIPVFSVPTIPAAVLSATDFFVHIPSSIGANEAEEIGVEHLLRDIKDAS